MDIKPIETCYNGYRFRSRLEARWAVFMDALGIKYEYEPEGFELQSGWYLPDFWLPQLHAWLEIKPRDGVTDKAFHLAKELCEGTKNPVLISNGLIEKDTGDFHHYLFLYAYTRKYFYGTMLADSERYRKIEDLEEILEETLKENKNAKLTFIRKKLIEYKTHFDIKALQPTITQTLCTIGRNYFIPEQLVCAVDEDICIYNKIATFSDISPFFDGLENVIYDNNIYFSNCKYYTSDDIIEAIHLAKSARFEHGEAPRLNVVPQRACSL